MGLTDLALEALDAFYNPETRTRWHDCREMLRQDRLRHIHTNRTHAGARIPKEEYLRVVKGAAMDPRHPDLLCLLFRLITLEVLLIELTPFSKIDLADQQSIGTGGESTGPSAKVALQD